MARFKKHRWINYGWREMSPDELRRERNAYKRGLRSRGKPISNPFDWNMERLEHDAWAQGATLQW